MCLCALTATKWRRNCGVGWKVFSKTAENSFTGCYTSARPIKITYNKLAMAIPEGEPIGKLNCYVADNPAYSVIRHASIGYPEGFHLFVIREDAQNRCDEISWDTCVVLPVLWFGMQAAGFDGSNRMSSIPVIVAEYIVAIEPDKFGAMEFAAKERDDTLSRKLTGLWWQVLREINSGYTEDMDSLYSPREAELLQEKLDEELLNV